MSEEVESDIMEEPESKKTYNYGRFVMCIMGYVVREYLPSNCSKREGHIMEIILQCSANTMRFQTCPLIHTVTFVAYDYLAILRCVHFFDFHTKGNRPALTYKAKFLETDLGHVGLPKGMKCRGAISIEGFSADVWVPSEFESALIHIYQGLAHGSPFLVNMVPEKTLRKFFKKGSTWRNGDVKMVKPLNVGHIDHIFVYLQSGSDPGLRVMVATDSVLKTFENTGFYLEKKLSYMDLFNEAVLHPVERDLMLRDYLFLKPESQEKHGLSSGEASIARLMTLYCFKAGEPPKDTK